MNNILIIFMLIFFMSCGEVQKTTDEVGDTQKSIFNYWIGRDNQNVYMDFKNMVLNQEYYRILNIEVKQEWINTLQASGRNTLGLSAGDMYSCGYYFTLYGNDYNGTMIMGHDSNSSPDSIATNACLQYDNECSIGLCNINQYHTFEIVGSVLEWHFFNATNSAYDSNENFYL